MTDARSTSFLADLLLSCIHREYPNRQTHILRSAEDVVAPRALTPSFFGCFDWHSAVHSHWSLVRLWRLERSAEFVPRVREGLTTSFSAKNLNTEIAFQKQPGRGGFELPYGGAWLLQLCAELREFAADADAPPEPAEWLERLQPLESIYRERFVSLLERLPCAVRNGEHTQTAFNLGLVWDWATLREDRTLLDVIAERARAFYLEDRAAPLAYEPGAYDFLSPALSEADLMRRVLPVAEFRRWLQEFLGELPASEWLQPVSVTDPADGKLAHFDGLNLSRAWMLEGIASELPTGSAEHEFLIESATAHREHGVASVTGEHYAGGHWLASFVLYLVTKRGISR
ncbi:MAG: DUF2891 domain-containing protein [Planctomycetota bacterium]